MSIQFDKEIFSDGNLILKVNFTGIKNNVVNATDLKMSIYAFDSNGQPKFSESLNFDQIKGLYEHLDQISIIRESAKTFSGKFVETTEEISVLIEKLKVVDSDVLKIVLDKIKDEGKIKSLFKALSEEEIDDLSSLQKVQAWRGEIENLKKLLALEDGGKIVEKIIKFEGLKSYVAKQPEKIFQN